MCLKPHTDHALWISIQNIDWLVSYAADEYHYQGVSSFDLHTAVAAEEYEIRYTNKNGWVCKINVGPEAGMISTLAPNEFTKEMYERTLPRITTGQQTPKTWDAVQSLSRKEIVVRKVSGEYMKLWAAATVQGSRHRFEGEYNVTSATTLAFGSKKRKICTEFESKPDICSTKRKICTSRTDCESNPASARQTDLHQIYQ